VAVEVARQNWPVALNVALSPLAVVSLPVVVEGPHESSPGGESTAVRSTESLPSALDVPLPVT
jgi:hypothetical protein